MLRVLFYGLIFSIFFIDFFSISLGVLPRLFTLVPEVLSGAILAYIIVYGAVTKRFVINIKYVLLFAILIVEIIAGIILNNVDLGTVFVAVRYYFKYVPLFLLPAVILISREEFSKQLKLLFFMGLVQLPVVIAQYVKFGARFADYVSGTLVVTGTLSMFLISCISVAIGFYFKDAISFGKLLLVAFLLFLPTALGETKATLVFLPVAFVAIVALTGVWKRNKLKIAALMASIVMLVSSYSFIYSQFQSEYNRMGHTEGFFEFFTTTDPMKGMRLYVYSGRTNKEDNLRLLKERDSPVVGKRTPSIKVESIRRVDALVLTVEGLSQDFSKLLLGVGMGNASLSFIDRFSGEYAYLAEWNIAVRAITVLLWELGVLGLLIFLTFFGFIAYDAVKVSRRNDIFGYFATGWIGVVAIFVISMPYTNFIIFNVLGFLFWYFSGVIAVKRIEIEPPINATYAKSG